MPKRPRSNHRRSRTPCSAWVPGLVHRTDREQLSLFVPLVLAALGPRAHLRHVCQARGDLGLGKQRPPGAPR